MADLLLSLGLSCAITAVMGLWMIPFLRRVRFGQPILKDGPAHQSKQGTPTMGGFMFMVAVSAASIIVGWPLIEEKNDTFLFILLLGWLFGMIGFVDDYAKIKKQNNKGLSALQKLALQAAVAVAFMSLLRYQGWLSSDVAIPFTTLVLPVHWVLFLVVGIIVVCGFVNAVNLTDGLDGLCAGMTLPVALFFALVAYGRDMPQIAIVAAALAGGMIGFLFFNRYPAKVFMGDTGSLFLGGMLCGISFAMDAPLLLIIVGLVYIIEMLSVMIQVSYFKLTHGKRFFKMAPLHHHFEKLGWSEVKIDAVFVSITAALCVLAYLGVQHGG
ncbi:phospho-N-acetylmuramoyl-pentapeptide-transferase [Clostridia bacterium]|nr:phospho-N-acetylmuramoyl-pentapeptide-transferase [Clostridia bacterium]